MCSKRLLLFVQLCRYEKWKKQTLIFMLKSSTININNCCRMEKKYIKSERFWKFNLAKFVRIVIAACVCVYSISIVFHSTFFSVCFFFLLALFRLLCCLPLNFFIHYINSFLIEIFPSEFSVFPLIRLSRLFSRTLNDLAKYRVSWIPEIRVCNVNLWNNTIFDTSST